MEQPDPTLDRTFHQGEQLRDQFLHTGRVEMRIERLPADPALVNHLCAGLPLDLVRFVIEGVAWMVR